GHAAHQSLVARGVAVRIGTRASAVCEKGVRLSGNEFLSAATVLCTIGTRPNPLVERTLLTVEHGRIVVNADLGAREFAGLWAIGDCALIRNAHNGSLAPPTAQFAVAEARAL